jgi:hypothetical protein
MGVVEILGVVFVVLDAIVLVMHGTLRGRVWTTAGISGLVVAALLIVAAGTGGVGSAASLASHLFIGPIGSGIHVLV